MRIFWGFVLVLFGIAYLGAGLGWWNYNIPNSLWQFWPLIFVFWGIDLLTRNTNFYIPVMIIAVILSGAFIYLFLFNSANNLNWLGAKRITTNSVETNSFSADVSSNAKKAEISVDTGAVDFRIEGSTSKLLEGELVSNFAEPKMTTSERGDTVTASLSTVNTTGSNSWWTGRNLKNSLTMELNKEIPVDLRIQTGASKLNLDLSDIKISGMTVKTGATSIFSKLGDKILDGAIVNVEAGASSIEFNIPKTVGVKVTTETGLSSKNFKDYTQKDGAWYSKDYDSAKTKIEIRIKAGASSVTIR